MKVLLYMAMSANGIIADETGDEEFLSHYNWEMFRSLAKSYGCFIWGRKTYEAVRDWGNEYCLTDLSNVERIVISQQTSLVLDEGFTVANSPKDALEKLENKGLTRALVAGGATLNSVFAAEGLLDEILLNVESVFIGKGTPLFDPKPFEIRTSLLSAERFGEGGLTVRYRVEK